MAWHGVGDGHVMLVSIVRRATRDWALEEEEEGACPWRLSLETVPGES